MEYVRTGYEMWLHIFVLYYCRYFSEQALEIYICLNNVRKLRGYNFLCRSSLFNVTQISIDI